MQVYFDLQNSNLMSIFVGRDRKTSIIRKMRIFQLCAFGDSLCPTLLAMGAIAQPKLRMGPDNSTLVAVHCNKPLELIGIWTAEVHF